MTSKSEIPLIDHKNSIEFHFGHIKWKAFNKDRRIFHINKLEEYRDKIRFPLPPHRKQVYDFIFLTNGKSVRYKGLNKYEITKNQFFFLPPFQITSHESMSKNASGYFLHFDVEIFASCNLHHELEKYPFLNFISNPLVSISSPAVVPILNILQRLEKLYKSHRLPDHRKLAFYILSLLEEVVSCMQIKTESKKQSSVVITQQYQDLLSRYIYQKNQVSDFANMLHVTPNHLNKCVKNTTGKTAQTLLNEMVLLEAKSLLHYSHLTIAEIADKLSNKSPSNFTRFFKSMTGQSPKEYLHTAN